VSSALIRCGIAAIALLIGAWLVLSFRAVELEADGRTIFEQGQRGPIQPGEVRRAQSFFDRAGRFSADKSPLVYEGFLLFDAGRYGEAAAAAEQLVADEPDNIDGWIVLYLAARGPEGSSRERDPGRAAEALRMVRALNPLAASTLR
jgi:hypothetical protein